MWWPWYLSRWPRRACATSDIGWNRKSGWTLCWEREKRDSWNSQDPGPNDRSGVRCAGQVRPQTPPHTLPLEIRRKRKRACGTKLAIGGIIMLLIQPSSAFHTVSQMSPHVRWREVNYALMQLRAVHNVIHHPSCKTLCLCDVSQGFCLQ